MKEMFLNDIRKVQIELLEDFHNFCEKNKLRYFLDAGTLLGAIRHNGFIPWDDDMDVSMPREDYNKFMLLAKDGYGNSILLPAEDSIYNNLKILDKRTKLIEFPQNIRNEIAVYIDVYPKDGLPDNSFKSYWLCKKVHYLDLLYWFNKVSIHKWKKSANIMKRMAAFLGRGIMNDKFKYWPLKKTDQLATRYKFDESPYVATIIACGMNNCVKRACFESKLVKFENLMLNIPVGYDDYLKALYGDYMTPPPPEKRAKHDNVVYWIGS